MGYQTLVLPAAEADLDALATSVRRLVIKKITWLSENAAEVIHHPLKGMSKDLTGLCKLRVGDYRVLYWKVESSKQLHIFRIKHRSEVYKRLSH